MLKNVARVKKCLTSDRSGSSGSSRSHGHSSGLENVQSARSGLSQSAGFGSGLESRHTYASRLFVRSNRGGEPSPDDAAAINSEGLQDCAIALLEMEGAVGATPSVPLVGAATGVPHVVRNSNLVKN